MAVDYGTFFWGSGGGSGGGGGGGGGSAQKSGSVALGNAASSVAVVYTGAISSALIPIFSFANVTDTEPIFIEGYVSAYSTTGFTVTFNAPTDSVNYIFNYAVFGAI